MALNRPNCNDQLDRKHSYENMKIVGKEGTYFVGEKDQCAAPARRAPPRQTLARSYQNFGNDHRYGQNYGHSYTMNSSQKNTYQNKKITSVGHVSFQQQSKPKKMFGSLNDRYATFGPSMTQKADNKFLSQARDTNNVPQVSMPSRTTEPQKPCGIAALICEEESDGRYVFRVDNNISPSLMKVYMENQYSSTQREYYNRPMEQKHPSMSLTKKEMKRTNLSDFNQECMFNGNNINIGVQSDHIPTLTFQRKETPKFSTNSDIVDKSQPKKAPITTPAVTATSTSTIYDGTFFLELVKMEKSRLIALADAAERKYKNNDVESSIGDVRKITKYNEDLLGLMHSAVGQARLLVSKKMKQFENLCYENLYQDPNNKKVTENDLHGFWDLMKIQIDRIKSTFAEIEKSLKPSNSKF